MLVLLLLRLILALLVISLKRWWSKQTVQATQGITIPAGVWVRRHQAHHSRVITSFLAAVCLCAAEGCRPTLPAAATSQPASPPPAAEAAPTTRTAPPSAADNSTARPPTAEDYRAFSVASLPADLKVTEVKIDPPVRLPDAPPGSNAWLLSVKVVLTPAEDLLALPAAKDGQAIDNLVAELNALVHWRNAYVKSPFAKACGQFEVKLPASPPPQLLVVAQPKDKPLAPLYGKVAAEWQVDHWQFEPRGFTTMPTFGQPRSAYKGATMVQGSPEAEQMLGELRADIAQARKDIAAVRIRYAEQVTRGTKAGSVYQGRLRYAQEDQACEVRFMEPVGGSSDGRSATLEVRLPVASPPCTFTYNARLTPELPIPMPEALSATSGPNPYFDFENAIARVPAHNVSPRFTRSSSERFKYNTLPANVLDAGRSNVEGGLLLLTPGHLEGSLSQYVGGGIHLSAQQTGTPTDR